MMKVIVVRARPLFCGVFAAVLLFGFLGALRAPLVRAVFASPAGRSLPIYSVQTDQPFAALGINCAWDDQDIPSMLQTLAKAQVHATFFLFQLLCLLRERGRNAFPTLPRRLPLPVTRLAVTPIPIGIWTP